MEHIPPPQGPPAPRASHARYFIGFRSSIGGVQYIDTLARRWSCNRSEAIRRVLADHARRNRSTAISAFVEQLRDGS